MKFLINLNEKQVTYRIPKKNFLFVKIDRANISAFVKKNDGGFLFMSSDICHGQFS